MADLFDGVIEPNSASVIAPNRHENAEERMRKLDEKVQRKKGWVCGSCASASRWVTENGHDTGMIACAELRERHVKRSHHLLCAFEPSRFRPAAKALELKGSAR